MDDNKALELLKVEQACIRKAEAGCDRQCDKCYLVRPTNELLDMYSYLINKLERERANAK